MKREFDFLMQNLEFEIVAVNADLADGARIAWRQNGKGRHPAKLNMGDCFAYACARMMQEPLLAKGDEFCRTDAQILHV